MSEKSDLRIDPTDPLMRCIPRPSPIFDIQVNYKNHAVSISSSNLALDHFFTITLSQTTNMTPLTGLAHAAFVRPLSIADLDSCVEVESAFPEHERCSREKVKQSLAAHSQIRHSNKSQFIYRLTVCPEPCLGLFLEVPGSTESPQLVAHVIGNRLPTNRVTDGSMKMPDGWNRSHETVTVDGEVIGNDPTGQFIGVHSVAVRTEYQKGGFGRALMKAYVHYVRQSITAQSVVLIAHDHLIRFYESVGFKNLGPSPCAFAGGGWFDMVSLESFFGTWSIMRDLTDCRS